jgi:hypothetical protein
VVTDAAHAGESGAIIDAWSTTGRALVPPRVPPKLRYTPWLHFRAGDAALVMKLVFNRVEPRRAVLRRPSRAALPRRWR